MVIPKFVCVPNHVQYNLYIQFENRTQARQLCTGVARHSMLIVSSLPDGRLYQILGQSTSEVNPRCRNGYVSSLCHTFLLLCDNKKNTKSTTMTKKKKKGEKKAPSTTTIRARMSLLPTGLGCCHS